MDKINHSRTVIKQILSEHAEFTFSYDDIDVIPMFYERSDSYLLMNIGWANTGRVYSIPMHLRIKNDKVWLEQDNTDAEIAQQLIDAGIPKEELVLGFFSPEHRKLTECAVG